MAHRRRGHHEKHALLHLPNEPCPQISKPKLLPGCPARKPRQTRGLPPPRHGFRGGGSGLAAAVGRSPRFDGDQGDHVVVPRPMETHAASRQLISLLFLSCPPCVWRRRICGRLLSNAPFASFTPDPSAYGRRYLVCRRLPKGSLSTARNARVPYGIPLGRLVRARQTGIFYGITYAPREPAVRVIATRSLSGATKAATRWRLFVDIGRISPTHWSSVSA